MLYKKVIKQGKTYLIEATQRDVKEESTTLKKTKINEGIVDKNLSMMSAEIASDAVMFLEQAEDNGGEPDVDEAIINAVQLMAVDVLEGLSRSVDRLIRDYYQEVRTSSVNVSSSPNKSTISSVLKKFANKVYNMDPMR